MTSTVFGTAPSTWLWILLACTLGLLGNMCKLPLFFGVDLIFGSVAVMVMIATLGILPAIAAAFVGGLYTLVIWGHPYALVIFTAEALVVGILYQRFTRNLVLADLLFWLTIGIPLIAFFYHYMLELPWPRVFGIALKQPINGIINALIAGNLLIFFRLYMPQQWTSGLARPSVENILFHLLLGAIVLSGTMPLLFESRAHREQQELLIAERLQQLANNVTEPGDGHADHLATLVNGQYLRPDEGVLLHTSTGLVIARHGVISSWPLNGTIESTGQELTRWLPNDDIPSMVREQRARYRLEKELNNGLTLLLEHSATHVVETVERARLQLFEAMALLICLGVLISRMVSQRLTRPLHLLTSSEHNFTNIASPSTLSIIADSPIQEYQKLATVLQQAAGQLDGSFARQRQTQAELEQLVSDRTAALELVIANTGVGIWDWQVQSGVTRLNERWAEIIGYSLAELEPVSIQTWIDHTHPEDLAKSNTLLEACWSGNDARYECENRMRHKDGHWVWVLDTGRVVEWVSEGKPARMVGTHLDITRQKASREELIQARDAAESATRSKSEFLAVMSHEIRTPMNGVLGMLNLLDKTGLHNDQVRQIEMATSSAQSLLTLINDILDFSKIDAGHLDLESVPFDITLLFQSTVAALEYRAKEKQLDLQLDLCCNDINLVAGDPNRLRQILTNLIGNAIKFTDVGRVKINAQVQPHDTEHLRLYVEVSDSGIGITPDKLSQLFSPFTQAESSTARRFGGTGLGLSIVKQLCELLGGAINATSTPGVGSCFAFNITLRQVTEAESLHFATRHQQAAKARLQEEETEPSSAKRILLVEDHRINQEVVLGMLKGTDLSADIANNGKEALSMMLAETHSEPYTAILMDCQMPTMDGYETTHRIRAGEAGAHYRHIPIIAMTANAMAGDRDRCLDAGMNDYLSKPIEKTELAAVMQHWIALNSAQLLPDTTHSEPTKTKSWDASQALARMNNNVEHLQILIRLFFEEIPSCIADLRRAITNSDLEQAAFLAHSIKGMVGNLCADALQQAAGEVESAASQGTSERLPALYQELERAFKELSETLRAYQGVSSRQG